MEYATARLLEITNGLQPLCKICGQRAQLFDVVDLNKVCAYSLYPWGLAGVPVYYWCCPGCGFIFTNFFDYFTPAQWRRHIYNEDYLRADPEYSSLRARQNALEVESLLAGRRSSIVALDYGGGSGQTAAILRERGWICDTSDPFGQTDVSPERHQRYNFCSAFEVFEHAPDPAASLRAIVEICSPDQLLIFIGTAISDGNVRGNRLTWWYAAPRNGHVSLFSRKSLRQLGEQFGLQYESVSSGTHLLFRRLSQREAHWLLIRGKMRKRLRLAMQRVTSRSREPSN